MIDHFESDDNHIYYTLGVEDNEPLQKISKEDLFLWGYENIFFDEPFHIKDFRKWCNENWDDLLKQYVKNNNL